MAWENCRLLTASTCIPGMSASRLVRAPSMTESPMPSTLLGKVPGFSVVDVVARGFVIGVGPVERDVPLKVVVVDVAFRRFWIACWFACAPFDGPPEATPGTLGA